jgi:SAM-dependent methyltransferase
VQSDLTDPDLAEQLGIKYSDDYARSREWEFNDLLEPKDALKSFYEHLPGNRMLDIGCGWARYVHRFVDHALAYTGIDHSPAMVTVARETYPDQRFELMSYRKLTFPDESFDGLWCCCAFSGEPKHNMPMVLQELKRVLVPGGIIMVVMPAVYESHEGMQSGDDGKPLLYHSHYELDELVCFLEEAGFSTITTKQYWDDGAMSVLVKK